MSTRALQAKQRQPNDAADAAAICHSERLAEVGVESSVDSRGDSYDNALAETINGLYKAEMIHWRGYFTARGCC